MSVETEMRVQLARWLEQNYNVKDVSRGSGVPKLSRLEVSKGGTTLRYAVKISTNTGRISFSRNDNGEWKLLSEVDRIIYGFVSPENRTQLQIKVFHQSTVLDAFENTYQKLKEQGNGHIPIWLSPEKEDGLRFYGSGFGQDAHTEAVLELDLSEISEEQSEQTEGQAKQGAEATKGGIMNRIKSQLADHMGVDPNRIEVEVRIRP